MWRGRPAQIVTMPLPLSANARLSQPRVGAWVLCALAAASSLGGAACASDPESAHEARLATRRAPSTQSSPEQGLGDAREVSVTAPLGFVVRRGANLWLDGSPFRFVGANIAGLAHYGVDRDSPKDPHPCPVCKWGKRGDIDVQLESAKRDLGARVVRIFAPNHVLVREGASHQEELGDRLRDVLDAAHRHDLRVIVSFIDYYDNAYHLPEDGGFYTNRGKLSDAFFSLDRSPNYTSAYLPYVRAMVERFRDRPEIFAWELGNELRNLDGPADDPERGRGSERFIRFAEHVTREIRALDAHHLITLGMMSTRGFDDAQRLRLAALPDVDIVTSHVYDGDRSQEDESVFARLAQKPFVVEEIGIDARSSTDRSVSLSSELDHWLTRRSASGVMPWGYSALGHDFGDGDGIYGIDRIPEGHGPDYDSVTLTLRTAAAALEASPSAPCDSGEIVLRASTGFVRSNGDGSGRLIADIPDPGLAEPFRVVIEDGAIVLSTRQGAYVAAEGGGSRELVANRMEALAWERFGVVKKESGFVLLASDGTEVRALPELVATQAPGDALVPLCADAQRGAAAHIKQ